ncbi:hypothetical protein CDAR_504341 [Caerostris darwini]|uniref:Uncharacterized protein n=1 Tax=Caerostris darwini TaxID=1538125 RepID=A0AAV4RXK6_9ARAC|nr:hypothetical protein CDAR_504341 [Caerostris darwini]
MIKKLISNERLQIIIIDCGKLNIDEMIALPSNEQYQLTDEILQPIIDLKQYQNHNSLSTPHEEMSTITIEMRKPTIEQLLCLPTVEQYNLKDPILTPIIRHKAKVSTIRKPSNITRQILIQFGKP